MKKEKHNLHDMLGAFVNEEHHEEATRWLYPLFNVDGKKQAKQAWQDMGAVLTTETFDIICNVAQEQTGIDVRINKNKNRKISLTQFLVSYALYCEFVTTKKITLKQLCTVYMPWLNHSQILYAVNAIEKNIDNESVCQTIFKFALAIEAKGLSNTNRRIIALRAALVNPTNLPA